uniref:Phycocyanin alpha phycocyanobilin lyase n=1 Tax=Paulinella micropora TaxID=1928728 RepID=A0A385I0T6_9EUKA|nr:phycocyanin alpha phycocyanobilin lyase [Paulinella micropora]AXY63547.1 phycocyanin alpha phycocyanobilin lyase [Paulinella micropora]
MNRRPNEMNENHQPLYDINRSSKPLSEAEALFWLKQDNDISMQYYAAWWLGRNRSTHPDTVPLLCKALDQRQKIESTSTDSNKVAYNAARALGKLNNRAAVPRLLQALQEDDYKLKEASARSLGDLRIEDAVEPLMKILAGGPQVAGSVQENSPRLKEPCESILEALGNIGCSNPEVLSILKSFSDHDRPIIRGAACRALLQLTGDTCWANILTELLSHHQLQVRRSILIDIGAIGWRPALKPIMKTLAENSLKLIALRGLIENSSPSHPQDPSINEILLSMDQLL